MPILPEISGKIETSVACFSKEAVSIGMVEKTFNPPLLFPRPSSSVI
jgi:hypothetical protein